MAWGATTTRRSAYLFDKRNGATMVTVAVAHAIDAVTAVLGEFAELSATTAVRQRQVQVDDGSVLTATAPDQAAIQGTLQSGAVASIVFRGGESRARPICGGTSPAATAIFSSHRPRATSRSPTSRSQAAAVRSRRCVRWWSLASYFDSGACCASRPCRQRRLSVLAVRPRSSQRHPAGTGLRACRPSARPARCHSDFSGEWAGATDRSREPAPPFTQPVERACTDADLPLLEKR